MNKANNTNAKHQRWKQRLRDDCIRRVRAQRDELILRIREGRRSQCGPSGGDVKDALGSVITEAAISLRSDAALGSETVSSSGGSLDPARPPRGSELSRHEEVVNRLEFSEHLGMEEYADLMSAMEAELLMEEERLAKQTQEAALADYEEACMMEAEVVAMDVLHYAEDAGMHLPREQGAVLCPVCERVTLIQLAPGSTGAVIGCRNPSCNMRIDCSAEGLGLDYLCHRLSDAISTHSDGGCTMKPSFKMENRFGMRSLWMSCGACGFMQIVM
eukprot:CAMPEP_0117697110 /NCGR_PEP_ID=MMETSP0804-20121206/29044_1 /TAXON_ID=1074897 /ORGANISM="Tetraselmis astigmatica, Strain CCMP880" /LENGTH=272 /DNA_ID=CAMNT_0005511319 /DNA_START=137 /DNA_END=958 /DNA_ORIENTATION=-